VKLTHDEITRCIAGNAVLLGIDIEKVRGINLYALVEGIKEVDFRSKRAANATIHSFMKKEFKGESAA
jgi:hypothetical protein